MHEDRPPVGSGLFIDQFCEVRPGEVCGAVALVPEDRREQGIVSGLEEAHAVQADVERIEDLLAKRSIGDGVEDLVEDRVPGQMLRHGVLGPRVLLPKRDDAHRGVIEDVDDDCDKLGLENCC